MAHHCAGCSTTAGVAGCPEHGSNTYHVAIDPDLTGRIVPYLSTVDALRLVRLWVAAIGCVDMSTRRRIKKADAIAQIDVLVRAALEGAPHDPE